MPNEKTMRIEVKPRKARNPLVAVARFRHAGSHEKTPHALRQEAKRALQRELVRLHLGRGDDE
ncbi:hypothetical protein X899_2994 [Burkholderia pseudomallei TSV 25]|uniref:hypothetical protein n=1 Tax=Burkholderia pseudomallei TaxID=28450 RepID=UPI000510315D|nr:hypothetical protein [Burkholderia pseudomallei]AIV49444.1 hypothetical protein X988_768 [Burkholderia pseudomallei TSV 48]KGC35461.1 hypothetical protein DO64_4612 [Burkholderia pseudomallei]KGW09806.1 hypothetical protein X899_2994 [Burkholderia pseudomallei TSV 25]